jgi:UDP-N-acetylmuramoylalanine-D-glutamate ligase
MARKLPAKDAVIIGLGWTGCILAQELTEEGLDVEPSSADHGATPPLIFRRPMRLMSCATACATSCFCVRHRRP